MPRTARVEFYKHKNPPGLQGVSIRQKIGSHTIMLADYDIRSGRDFLLPPENLPVALEYGQGPTGLRVTYGYVNHNETVVGGDGKTLTRMVLLGTSKAMNTAHPTSWTGYSNSGIAREIATRHRLRSVVHSHPFVKETWMSGGRTDFQCLQALADEIGYLLWVDGSTLWFLDPTQLVRSASNMTTRFVRTSQIRKITTMVGSNIPGEMVASKRVVQYGIDKRTNAVFEVSSGSRDNPTELGTGSPDGYTEAQQGVAATQRSQRDQQVLKASVNGDASLTPGTLVEFEVGQVNQNQAGVWAIHEATHDVFTKDYVTHLVCSRESAASARAVVPNTVRDVSGFTRAVIRNGKIWEAELQERVYV